MSRAVRHARVAVFLLIAAAALGVPPAPADQSGEYDPHRVLVAFRPGTPASGRAAAHAQERGRVENTMDWLNLDVVRLPDEAEPKAVAARYEHNPNVAYAHPNWKARLQGIPNDQLFAQEWGLNNTGQSVIGSFVQGIADADIDAPEGWDAAFGPGTFPSAGGTRVGVLDTGVDRTHVDLLNKTVACATAVGLTGRVTEGTCSDDNSHGTHVSGTIAAVTNNGIGVAGVAPNAVLAEFKALNAAGVGFYSDIIAGIHWLHTTGGARIISMSIGGPYAPSLDNELSEAAAAGTLLIAAAGNEGDSTENYPAAHPDVVSVAATDAGDGHADFSNCNGDVEIAAPGVDVWSTVPGNGYAVFSGTSMATPHVSGVAALVMSVKGLDANATRNQLNSTADDLGPPGHDSCFGFGRVNLASALGAVAPPPPPPPPPVLGGIAGTVSDLQTHAGIGGATVSCEEAGNATTASNGGYTVSDVAAGTYTCTAIASGYRSKSQGVTVNSGQTATADFRLRRQR